MSQSTIRHPLAVLESGSFDVTWSDASTVRLGRGRSDFLVHTLRRGRRPLVVTPETSRLSFGMLKSLRAVGGDWLFDSDSGLRGLNGMPAGLPGWDSPGSTTAPWAGEVGDAVQFSVSLHHTARVETTLGAFAEHVIREGHAAWGGFESPTKRWDRTAMTRFVQRRMPRQTRLFFEAEGIYGCLRVERSQFGIIEESTVLVPGMSPPEASEVLRMVAAKDDVLVATAWSCRAGLDGTVGAELNEMLRPIAFAVGTRVRRHSEWEPPLTSADIEWLGPRRKFPTMLIDLAHAGDEEIAAVGASAIRAMPELMGGRAGS